jgi:hypothetical protein
VKCVKRETFTVIGYTPEGDGSCRWLMLSDGLRRNLPLVGAFHADRDRTSQAHLQGMR